MGVHIRGISSLAKRLFLPPRERLCCMVLAVYVHRFAFTKSYFSANVLHSARR